MHNLMLIVGRTASGKDRLTEYLCREFKFKQLVSYTTRPKRESEGHTHEFVTKQDYEQMKADNQIAAFTEINGNYYWCTKNQLYESDIYIIDPKGIETLKSMQLPDLNLFTVYINTPDNIRKERALKTRKDDASVFRARDLDEKRQFREFLQDAKFDYAVSNIEFAKAYSVLSWICDVEALWKNRSKK